MVGNAGDIVPGALPESVAGMGDRTVGLLTTAPRHCGRIRTRLVIFALANGLPLGGHRVKARQDYNPGRFVLLGLGRHGVWGIWVAGALVSRKLAAPRGVFRAGDGTHLDKRGAALREENLIGHPAKAIN